MERRLKERLIGAAVLVLLAIIFIPMLLNDTTQYNSEITGSNIPARPEDEFNSRIVPLEEGQREQGTAPPEDSGAGANETSPPPLAGTAIREQGAETALVPATGAPPPAAASNTEDLEPGKAALPGKAMGVRAWIVQLGSFSSEENAQLLNNSLRNKGFTAFVEPLKQQSMVIYRVRVGPELLRSDAEKVRDKIKQSMQMDGLVVPYP